MYKTTGKAKKYRTVKTNPLHSLQEINGCLCSIQITSTELKQMSLYLIHSLLTAHAMISNPKAIYRLQLLYVHNSSNEND
jgi:hypothetical protein